MKLPCGHDSSKLGVGGVNNSIVGCYQCGQAYNLVPTPSPDVPESVGQGVDLRDWFAGQAIRSLVEKGHGFVFNKDEVASCAYMVADAMLSRRSKGHAPTQLPARSLDFLRILRGSLERQPDVELIEVHRGNLIDLIRVVESSAAPSTTATGQSLSVPPATEGTAEAVREVMRDAFNYADSLEGATPAYISSKFRYIAENLQRLAKRLEVSAAAVPVEELEALVQSNTTPSAFVYNVCGLIDKYKAGEQ